MNKLASKLKGLCISGVICLTAFLNTSSYASTVLSRPVGEYTIESAFVARILVKGFRSTEIAGFPHRVIDFSVVEVFKGRGDVGDLGSFTVPGGRKIGTDKVYAIGGGMTSFLPDTEYIVFLKDMPVFGDRAHVSESVPNVLVGWTALQVVYQDDGQRALKQAGNLGEMRSALSLSSQKFIRHRNSLPVEDYDTTVSEITRAAAE